MPERDSDHMNTVGEPDEGKPHVRFDEGRLARPGQPSRLLYNVVMAKARIRPESVGDVQAATKKMFAAINAAQPEGIRYASLLLDDGETVVAIAQVDDGVENPIPGFPEFRELQEVVDAARAEPNSLERWTVVGSYRLF